MNPYAGRSGYNTALDHAVCEAARIINAEHQGDENVMRIGIRIIAAIAGLHRKQRHRRRPWRTPLVEEVS